uniref:Tick transposon n=1 Tax=Rhipicephalus appendiculatus TaxID=34631 RepID=A0A131YPU6_RHIAP
MHYVHSLFHKFRKVGARYGVNVLFSAPNKVGKVGIAVQRKLEALGTGCQIRRVNKFFPCKVAVVYQIPLSCGRCHRPMH